MSAIKAYWLNSWFESNNHAKLICSFSSSSPLQLPVLEELLDFWFFKASFQLRMFNKTELEEKNRIFSLGISGPKHVIIFCLFRFCSNYNHKVCIILSYGYICCNFRRSLLCKISIVVTFSESLMHSTIKTSYFPLQ